MADLLKVGRHYINLDQVLYMRRQGEYVIQVFFAGPGVEGKPDYITFCDDAAVELTNYLSWQANVPPTEPAPTSR